MALVNGRAKKCQTYPDEFCDAICQGVKAQVKKDIEDKVEKNRNIDAISKAEERKRGEAMKKLIEMRRPMLFIFSGRRSFFHVITRKQAAFLAASVSMNMFSHENYRKIIGIYKKNHVFF